MALLGRHPYRSAPTDVAGRLLPAYSDVLAAVTALVDRAASIRAEADHLTIAATRHVADHFLPDWLALLAGHRVSVVELDTLRVARSVRAGKAAIGFTEGPSAPIGLRSQVVAVEEVLAVVGRSHPWYGRRTTVGADEFVTATTISSRPGSAPAAAQRPRRRRGWR